MLAHGDNHIFNRHGRTSAGWRAGGLAGGRESEEKKNRGQIGRISRHIQDRQVGGQAMATHAVRVTMYENFSPNRYNCHVQAIIQCNLSPNRQSDICMNVI